MSENLVFEIDMKARCRSPYLAVGRHESKGSHRFRASTGWLAFRGFVAVNVAWD